VTAIRTVTVTMSPLFRDLVARLMARHGGLDLVAELTVREGLEERLQLLLPALILVGLERNEGDEIGLSLVRLLPRACVIAFSADGRNVFVHRMRPHRSVLLDVSPQMLVNAILRL
jgi:hypothetical protein